MKNVFLVGLDDLNARRIHRLPQATEIRLHPLLRYEQTHGAREYDVRGMLAQAERQLQAESGSIDAITGYWDFPVSSMVPILCRRRGLRSAPLESVLRCEHKYWSRVLQREASPDNCPPFQPFDPFDDGALDALELDYPFWIKPIKSFGSHLGFRVDDESDWRRAIPIVRRGIERLTAPFKYVMSLADVPREIQEDRRLCVAEGIIGGRQCTLEGYVFEGEVHVYGVVDSIRFAGMSTFARFQYPSTLPELVQQRMITIVRRVMGRMGYDNATFNVELFHDPEGDRIWVLEINTRMAQSHADLFYLVDGASNHSALIDVALGRRPSMPQRQGRFGVAAKLFIREFEDGTVSHAPSASRIDEAEARFPGTVVEMLVQPGDRLSDLEYQDSYSYKLGIIYMGAADEGELLDKFARCVEFLDLRVNDLQGRERTARAHSKELVEARLD